MRKPFEACFGMKLRKVITGLSDVVAMVSHLILFSGAHAATRGMTLPSAVSQLLAWNVHSIIDSL